MGATPIPQMREDGPLPATYCSITMTMARGPDLVEWEPRPQTGIPDKKNGADATQQQQ